MKRRSFSFLLARRYLNPRRSMLSSFSLISLIGIVLGVLALVVVMAVFSGMERNTKSRVLGTTPHVLLKSSQSLDGRMGGEDAARMMETVKTLPHVQSAGAFVADSVGIDTDLPMSQPYVSFTGIDTSDEEQMKGLEKMLDLKNYPESRADLGIEDRAVISSSLANGLGLAVGDKLSLVSTKGAKDIVRIYKVTDNPPVREAYAETWKAATGHISGGWKNASGDTLSQENWREAYGAIQSILTEDLHETEHDLLEEILLVMDEFSQDEAAGLFRAPEGGREKIEKAIAALNATDKNELDLATFRGLKSLILPKEAVVAGVYQASMMMALPDLYVPLPLAQDLAGLDDSVMGISIRLDDPYRAEVFAVEARQALGEQWVLETWGYRYGGFFTLIEQQRGMMYFVLVFIMLVSAFSIMAVMFTITIQKRREIGVMKALGAAPGQIVRVFLHQGMILGALGGILGIVLGRIVLHFRGELQSVMRGFGFDPFNATLLGSDVLPAHSNPVEQAAFGVAAFVLCSVAALVPAFIAARSDAAKSLRNL